ncbi:MAG TPA: hypothetical protein VGE98_09905 [Thermoanaerobaculia bacterium]
MNLVYALGGGLGHLTRARALLHTLGVEGPVTVVVSSPHATDPRARGDWSALAIPEDLARDAPGRRAWLLRKLDRLAPQALYVDAFPGGVLGELCGLPDLGVPLVHCARRLRLSAYRERLHGPLPRFDRTYQSEPIDDEHRALLADASERVEPLALHDPPAAAPFTLDPGERWELIVHSGPDEEILELVAYAEDIGRFDRAPLRRLLLAPQRPAALPSAIEHADLYPAWPLFANAARIVTACGANAMRQTAEHRDRHRFLPFERPLDDQFARARSRWRSSPPAHGAFGSV